MKNTVIYCAILIALAGSVNVGASECGDHLSSPAAIKAKTDYLRSRPHSISVTRFNNIKSFKAALRFRWKEAANGYFVPLRSRETVATEEEGTLASQQSFPLQIMTETGYLKPEQARSYSQLAEKLETVQIAFVESTREVERNWVYKTYGENSKARIDDFAHRDFDNDTIALRTASMWSVAGQTLDPIAGMIRSVPLPWQLEPHLKTVSDTHLDRKKFRFIWEWGRAAQEINGENRKLREAMAIINYQELAAMNGKMEEAFVMFHSLGREKTELYLKEFPGTLFPSGHTNLDEALFLVPLKDILEKYKPSRVSVKINELILASNSKLSESKAIDLHNEIRLLLWDEVDFTYPDKSIQKSPVVITDIGLSSMHLLSKVFEKYGIQSSNDNPHVRNYLKHHIASYHSWNRGQYVDVNDPAITHSYLNERNAIDISNLDLKAAKADKYYPLRVLFATYIYYSHLFTFPKQISMENLNQAVDLMAHNNIQFSISTYDPSISQVLSELGSELVTHQQQLDKSMQGSDLKNTWIGSEWMGLIYMRPIHMHFFTIENLVKLTQAHPQIFIESWGALQPGRWRAQYLLNDLDLF